ncbi:MAG: hypothetical protein WKF84_14850 [Pyrinomonadaceae bacterium]
MQTKTEIWVSEVYGTNHPTLTLEECRQGLSRSVCDRTPDRSRLKGNPLSLSPLYLSREERVVGLIRLLTIALRVLTLIEFQVRKKLQAEHTQLREIYAGNPKRATNRPTTRNDVEGFWQSDADQNKSEWTNTYSSDTVD